MKISGQDIQWAIPFFVRTLPMEDNGFPAGYFFNYGRVWTFLNCDTIHTLQWIFCPYTVWMALDFFFRQFAVPSIPSSDLSKLFFVTVWIFIKSRFIPMEELGFPGGFFNDKVIHR